MGSAERGRRDDERKQGRMNGDVNRRAAALAWYKHGRKASSMKLHNPSLSSPPSPSSSSPSPFSSPSPLPVHGGTQRRAPQQQHLASSTIREGVETLPSIVTRFRSEALALQPTPPNKQQNSIKSMTTEQSLALLSLLPHHQSQKRFYKATEDPSSPTAANTPWDCGSSLYDSFELLCLSNQLGRCLTTANHETMTTSSIRQQTSRRPTLQGPALPPTKIPRSLYALPQFILPNYLATKSSKKRSSLIHPIFCNMPTSISIPTSPSALPAPPPPPPSAPVYSHHQQKDRIQEKQPSKSKGSNGGLRRVFNSLLKTLHMKEGAPQAPKRSNLSEELEKLPKNRPKRAPLSSSAAHVLKDRLPPMKGVTSRYISTQNAPSSSPTSYSAPAPPYPHHHFRNEGFRTTSITRPNHQHGFP